MSELNNKTEVYYMSMGDTEYLGHGPYNSREDAAKEAVGVRQQSIEDDNWDPKFYTVCRIIPSLENAIQQTADRLPEQMQEWIDEWINDNVDGGTEDGVIAVQVSALDVIKNALVEVLTNHSVYHGNGAAVECIETKFEPSEVTDD